MKRHHFDSGGMRLAYGVAGEGEPILLIHGFASNIDANWVDPGWVATLTGAGRMVIAIDNRGHGDSHKSYDTADYEAPLMAEDARRLLDHLEIPQADVMGYSMGARIAAFLAIRHPQRVRSAIFGGLGMGMVEGVGAPEPIAAALEAPSADDVADRGARGFRVFAESTGSDLKALAACIRASRQKISPDELAAITAPVLVAVGTRDQIAGSASGLAALIKDARTLDIEGRDHMLAVGDKRYKQGVLDFLSQRP